MSASSSACDSPPSGASTYSYDASGNQTAGPSSFSGVYDTANRLITLDGDEFDYLSATNTELTAVGSTTYTNNLLGAGSQTTAGTTVYYTHAPDGMKVTDANVSRSLRRRARGSARGRCGCPRDRARRS